MPGLPYTEKVRQEAIARVLDSHTPVSQVAREVGCSIDTMHRWVREHRQQGAASGRKQGAVSYRQQGAVPRRKQAPSLRRRQDAPSIIVNKTPPATPPSQATFVPVNIIDARSHTVEIVTPHGVTLRLTDASPQYIAELLTALASC